MIIAVMSYNGREICFSASNEDEAKKAFPGGVVIRTLDADEAYSDHIDEAVYRAKEHKYRLEDALNHCEEYLDERNVLFDKDVLEAEGHLENIVIEFEHRFDCNLDENSIWNAVIENYFQDKL